MALNTYAHPNAFTATAPTPQMTPNAPFAHKGEKGNQNQNARQSGRYTSKTETLFV
ncbi:predicted protein [Sclerotinia sclerotiorum 1980 UF-70]|uniref:Uncharacterized protein n=1 Tax=Sclerotinia sclerotiorum (strain ATCC 18683 / 1980 / Ss-1) TaxID=665079 RepID=A7EQS6_SCLS1|nr:predicted protein [Sclerotinia sclerotiorum 1980 UF-70]EDN91818.1 predicted protein [Sclerotinia sclerotiorum 1980 UF-70]